MRVFSIFILGLGILGGAILLNWLASRLGLMSWYEFIKTPSGASPLSYIWLFVVYPLGLGTLGYFIAKVLNL